MFEQLFFVEKKYDELNSKLMQPDIVSNPEEYRKLMQEYSELTPIVETYRKFISAQNNVTETEQMLNDESVEADFREMLREELPTYKENLEKFTEELKILLLPKDPNDERNVIVEIRGGAGGEEASLFAHSLYRMYTMYADSNGWKHEILSLNMTELGGFKEVCFSIEGFGAYSKLKYESGVHRVQRVPETETQGRVHTSTATVAVLPEADDNVEIEIDPKDLKIDVFRASGAGGQHINKTESAVRIVHLPTNTVVECQDERSQFKNKAKAMTVLRSRLYDAKLKEHNDKIASERRSQIGSGDRSERIRTYNFPQNRLTDHRIGLTIHRLTDIMDGNIQEIIDALSTADRAEKLANQQDNYK